MAGRLSGFWDFRSFSSASFFSGFGVFLPFALATPIRSRLATFGAMLARALLLPCNERHLNGKTAKGSRKHYAYVQRN